MFQSIDAIKAIAAARTNEIVVTTMTTIFQWDDVVGDDPLHLPVIGAMGKASSVALGIAIAQPDRRVLCLDGDGSLLMNLGSFASVVASGVPNLVHFVFSNGAYNITGGQPIPAARAIDWPGLARASGYPNAARFTTPEDLTAALPSLIAMAGPTLVCVEVAPAGPQPKIQHGRMAKMMVRVREAIASA